MLFNSYEFVLLFLPLFMVGFYIVRHLGRQGKVPANLLTLYVLAGSAIFCALLGARNILVLLFSLLFNFCITCLIRKKPCKPYLAAGVIVNLVLLLFFKFKGTFFPVAISFYTFNQISFLVDFYRDEEKKLYLPDYLVYILFFPKFLQGPLMKFGAFKNELDKAFNERFDWENLMRALLLFSMGMFKKVILADTFGAAVDFAYGSLESLGSLEAILTAVFYSIQLYFDFSGYCDIAGAVCMMMGFELSLNFDSPYKAVNIIDFWKRWHISLTRFFTSYVYIPLGGNRKGKVRTYINLLLVFFLSGLWHGNGLNFIVWGLMHGILYVITRVISGDKKETSTENIFARVVKTILTFIYVTAAWVFFRAPSLKAAITLFARMFTGGKKALAAGFSSCFQLDEIWYILKVTPIMKLGFAWDICLWMFLVASVVIIFFCKNALQISKKCRIGALSTIATFIMLFWSIVSFAGVSTFLYMNF